MGSRLARVTVGAALIGGAAGGAAWASADLSRAPAAIVVVGTIVLALVGAVVLRTSGRARASWAGVWSAGLLWTAALVGSALGWPGWLTWGVLRGVGFVLVSAGLLIAPDVWRGGRDWGLLLLDGWLVGGSGMAVAWVVLGLTGGPLDVLSGELPPPLTWAALDLTAATVVAGLAVRTSRRTRPGVALVTAAALTAAAADATWAATGDAAAGIGLWLVMMALLGCSALTGTPELWRGSAPDPEHPQVARLSQLAVVPGLLFAIGGRSDGVTVGLAVSLLLALAAEMLLTSAQLRALWARSAEQTRQLDTVLSGSMDAILRLTARGIVTYANPAAAEVLGHRLESLLGHPLTEIIHPDDLETEMVRLGAGQVGEALRSAARFRRADGSWRHLESTVSRLEASPWRAEDTGGFVVIARDVEERVRLETELRREATTDALTGLLNRQAFLAAVEERLARGGAAVLFLDLDEFKTVNDTRGHEAGDELLVRVAHAIAVAAGPARPVARLGGDEFAVLAPIEAGEDVVAAAALAGRLVDDLGHDQGGERSGVSIGLAVADGGHVDELLGDADLAMYEAKGAGGGRVVVFEAEMRRRVVARAQLREDLERAILGGELGIDLQPIVRLNSGAWAGFEALVRWPTGGRVRPPDEFVPLAEETGLIVPLGSWVLRAALGWLATWPDLGAGVSVNVTGRQVAEPGFADEVRADLEACGLAPSRLTLEITEQTAVEDLGRAGAVLQPLRASGVHVSLDDFGTGYSSLGYLARLPVDELKIDRRFVSGLGRRTEDDALVRAVLRLAGDLGLRVVAEGVETPEQAATLRGYGCPLAQGYLYARPVPHTAIRRPPDAAGAAALPRQAGSAHQGVPPG